MGPLKPLGGKKKWLKYPKDALSKQINQSNSVLRTSEMDFFSSFCVKRD